MPRKAAAKINLRLEPELHRKLQNAVAESRTSLQHEIVARLEKSFANEDELMLEIKTLNARLDKANAEIAKAQTEMWTPLPKLGEAYGDWVKRITPTKK